MNGKYGFAGSVGDDYVSNILNGLEHPDVGGWGLVGCQIEEYPFGSGNPARGKARKNLMETRAVNRLIHQGENGRAGRDLLNFYKNTGQAVAAALGVTVSNGNKAGQFADGLVYCKSHTPFKLFQILTSVLIGVDFKNTPTTNDDSGYLMDSTSHNICAEPYGKW